MSQLKVRMTVEELRTAVHVYKMLTNIGFDLEAPEIEKHIVEYGMEDEQFYVTSSLMSDKRKHKH